MLAKKKKPQQRNKKKRPVAQGKKKGPAKIVVSHPPPEPASDEFTPLPRMTHVVFQSPAFQVTELEGSKAAIATRQIEPGEMLLVEHVVSGPSDYVLNCVLNDGPLFDVLYPRTSEWSVDRLLADELEPQVCDKVDANGFVHGDGGVSVGQLVSAFNHDDSPQAVVSSLSLATEDMSISPRMLYVLACDAVPPGKEVRIQYRDSPSAMHPYVGAEATAAAGAAEEGESSGAADDDASARAARKAARGWGGARYASGGSPAGSVEAASQASGVRAGGADEAEDTRAAALQAGVDQVRDLVMDYATSEAFVGLCVAHDRLHRALQQ